MDAMYFQLALAFSLAFIVKYHKKMTGARKNNQPDLIHQILTIPNLITLSRIACIPFIISSIHNDQHMNACLWSIYAAVSDFLDGYIARNWKSQASILGGILDPLADKLLIGSLAITFTIKQMIPLGLMVLIVGRDVILIVVSLYVRYTLLEKPVTFWKYVNLIGYSRTRVKAHWISKINTAFQLVLIIVTLPSCLLNYQESVFLKSLQIMTGLTTILSSITYIITRGAYEVVKD